MSSSLPTSPSSPTSTPMMVDYVVTGQTDGAPPSGSPPEIAQRAAALFDAITQGDVNVVDEYFGKQRNAPFQWYSMTEGSIGGADQNHVVAYTLDELAAYLERRYAHAVAPDPVQWVGSCAALCTLDRLNLRGAPMILRRALAVPGGKCTAKARTTAQRTHSLCSVWGWVQNNRLCTMTYAFSRGKQFVSSR